MITVPYKLQFIKGDKFIDITKFVETFDKFTDVGTGEIVSAKIMLDSRAGEFITESNADTTPIIAQYDTFLLTLYHNDDTTFQRFMLQDDISPQKNDEGTHLILNLLGRERYLQKMFFTGHYFWISFADMLTTIQKYYNDNRGTDQPFMHTYVADLLEIPKYTIGSFNFGDQTTVYEAMMEVVNRFKLPVASGGAGEFYGLIFMDDFTEDFLTYRVRPQGSVPEAPKTLPKPMLTTQVKQPSLGNVQIVQGAPGSGSLPRGPSLWRSLIEEYDNLASWFDDVIYKKDTYVTYQNKVYQCTISAVSAGGLPSGAGWTEVKFKDYVKNETGQSNFSYSPLTQSKAAVWKNRCGNSASGFLASNVPVNKNGFDALAVWDCNLVIRDESAWRDWVDVIAVSEADIPPSRIYHPSSPQTSRSERAYEGFRVLVDSSKGTIHPPFTGNDANGKSFRDAIVQMASDGQWIVYREAEQFDQCAVIAEGMVYQYNNPHTLIDELGHYITNKGIVQQDLAWRKTGDRVPLANDCFHYPAVFQNAPGLLGSDPQSKITLDNGEGKKFTDNSAIHIEYHFGIDAEQSNDDIHNTLIKAVQGVNAIFGDPFSLYTDENELKPMTQEQRNLLYQVKLYSNGWYAPLWSAPDPLTTDNFVTEKVGELFGGTIDDKRPTLDINNLNNTPSGNTGYGHDDSDLLGVLDGITFLLKFDIEGYSLNALRGDIPFRVFIYDIFGNVWKSDINYRIQGETQPFPIPFSSFTIYRSRTSIAFNTDSILNVLLNPELKITEIFQQRYVKRIGLQLLLPHDEQGRFDPLSWNNFLEHFSTFYTGTTIKFSGTVDAFHFTKTAVAVARDQTNDENSTSQKHLVAPIKQMPGISNVRQLEKIASSELDVTKHQNEYWTLRYDGSPGVNAEDSVFIKDIDFIAGAEKTDEPNTRRYIVKKITYSIGDRSSNSGLVATIEVFRRINT